MSTLPCYVRRWILQVLGVGFLLGFTAGLLCASLWP